MTSPEVLKQSFVGLLASSWELSTKMLPTVWQGLEHSQIRSLTVKFPCSRSPRPIITVPPMASLVSLRVLDIDPLCYVDDISLLLAGSKTLRNLTLVWSPRMREVGEPSVNLESIFGRCRAKDQSLKLKTVAIKNLFAYDTNSCESYFDPSGIEEVTEINSTAGLGDHGAAVFINSPFRKMSRPLPHLKSVRGDRVSKEFLVLLETTRGIEKLYIIGDKKADKDKGSSILPRSPASNGSSPSGDLHSENLRDDTIEAITQNHGHTLRHLLLPPQWRLTSDNIALIVRSCPNLEQIGFGTEFDRFMSLKLLMPFLTKVTAIRLLDNPGGSDFRDKMHEVDDGRHEEQMGGPTSARAGQKIRWIELADLLFEMGKTELMDDPENPGKMRYRRRVWKQNREAVKDIAIWKMDSLDV